MKKRIIFTIMTSLVTFCFADLNEIYENSWAIVIGINKYYNAPTLSYAVQDAESVKSMLVTSFDFPSENIVLLTDDQATKDNILRELSALTKRAQSNDRVLIFFAGHGQTMDLPNGGEAGYLLPIEGDDEDLYLSSIGMDELQKISSMSKSKHMLFLIDVCYGGIASIVPRSMGQPKGSGDKYIQKIIRNKARQIITAGGRGERVIEKPEWGHSAFTKNLLSGLEDWNADSDEDGYITADELGTYLKRQVSIDSENQQTPVESRFTNDEGEFIFRKKLANNELKENVNEANKLIIDFISRTRDEDIWWNLDDYDSESSEVSIVIYNSSNLIGGFQFSVSLAKLSGVTGVAAGAGFTLSHTSNIIMGYTMSRSFIQKDANNLQTLLMLHLQNNVPYICIQGQFTDNNGNVLSSYPPEVCLKMKEN